MQRNLDAEPGERVYAPASERVPREPAPGHRDYVEHLDTATAERQAAAHPPEPSFTRVPRPSINPGTPRTSTAAWRAPLALGIGWATLGACCALGVWLWMRWQRERNKPMNRIRRQAQMRANQARQSASELRDRVPDFR